MVNQVEVKRDENGWWTHPEMPEWGENAPITEINEWLNSNGLTWYIDRFENTSVELNDKWFVQGICDCSEWQPSCDEPDSFLLSIHDTEDGPVAVFAVPLP
jgi:hypothetical protein